MVHRLQDDSYCGSGEVGGWDGEEESYAKMWVIVKALGGGSAGAYLIITNNELKI